MIRRKNKRSDAHEDAEPKWFDDYEMRLGDVMRGERATMGKSLLDVQRELRIKANYIAAIENADPDAFDTPGFIAGYVRSYARYLGMDPDRAFAQFCTESGFSTAHGMSDAASSVRKEESGFSAKKSAQERDPIFEGPTPFAPVGDSLLSRIEPGAVGSLLVLVALVGALGFGGWTVLNEVQRVQLAPVENTPDVLADLDPLEQATRQVPDAATDGPQLSGASDGFDRLYRPEALEVPVLVSRDAPISTLNPSEIGTFAQLPQTAGSAEEDSAEQAASELASGVKVLAARPSWVRMDAADGTVLFSGILDAGATLDVPQDEAGPVIRVGESGAIYYLVDGEAYGPTGPRGAITENFSLAADDLRANLSPATLSRDAALGEVLASLGATPAPEAPAAPQVFAQERDIVTVIATREVWLRVRSAGGTVLHEAVMQPGDFYTVPQTDAPATIRAGDAGAVYFAANGQTYGPYGARGAVADNLKLSAETIVAEMQPADWGTNEQLARAVAQLDAEGAFEALAD